jgi:hypothetical protein
LHIKEEVNDDLFVESDLILDQLKDGKDSDELD